jgi:beta-galactosidase GanA
VTFTRDPDVDSQVAGIGRVEQVSKINGDWVVDPLLNGDQTDQGRQLSMPARDVQIFRVRLYSYRRDGSGRRSVRRLSTSVYILFTTRVGPELVTLGLSVALGSNTCFLFQLFAKDSAWSRS